MYARMRLALALRTLRRSPWYTATVVATIALSIALASTVFAVVDGVLFKPLPYPEADRLYSVVGSAGEAGGGTASLSHADLQYLNEADPRISATSPDGAVGLTHPDRPEQTIWSTTVDERFFGVLGVQPLVGGFTPAHFAQPASADAARPAVVSHLFWTEYLGGDASAIGRSVDMAGQRILIVGVLPRDFLFPIRTGRVRPDVAFPAFISPEAARDRWRRTGSAIVRLSGGITAEEANARLDAVLASHIDEYPPRKVMPGPYNSVKMQPLVVALGATERPLFRTAFGGAALLVILGAINVAGLFSARGRDRERELVLRTALGASRTHLAGLLITEAMLVALAGSIAGLLLAQPLLVLTLTLLPDSLLLLKAPEIDARVVTFAVLTATIVVTTFALPPVFLLVRRSLSERLAGTVTSTPRMRSWTRTGLIAVESALGITIVVAGSLILASFIVLRAEDAGFDIDGLAVLEVRMLGSSTSTDAEVRQDGVQQRLAHVPGVTRVAAMGVPLLDRMYGGSQFEMPKGAQRLFANDVPISPAFFDVMRLAAIAGRLLTEEEIEAGRPLAVVSDAMAKAYWPGTSALGQTLSGPTHTVTVVGVVTEALIGSQDEGERMGEIYIPLRLSRSSWRVHLLRTSGDPNLVVREAALAVNRDVPGVLVRRAESLDSAVSKSVRLHRFRMFLFTTCAAAGLLLVAVGIGGLVATNVARRVREIGIRSALGATRTRLVRMVIVDHLRPAVLGAAAGLLASWWAARLLSAFLYEIDAHEPVVWAAAAVTLIVVTVIAAWIPARRASSVDAMRVLKSE
jgi:putative ABC transport system permease protein